jgi:predicted Zn-dependent protease with MMP-like domain
VRLTPRSWTRADRENAAGVDVRRGRRSPTSVVWAWLGRARRRLVVEVLSWIPLLVGGQGVANPAARSAPCHPNPPILTQDRAAHFVEPREASAARIRLVVSVSPEDFEVLVERALQDIPAELRTAMENVVVLIDEVSPPGRLLGLYQGVPLTNRGHYSAAMPDRITIFKEAICAMCENTQEVERQVRKTVIHEVGHHFGISDPRLRELGW